MSLVYRFRITFEDYDEVSRDIEVKSTQTFEDLHHTIQAAIGFDGTKPASFYMSNDKWVKGKEISLDKRVDKNGEIPVLMKDSKLCNFIADPHQKIYYVTDYDANWSFFMELVKILPAVEITKTYPACVKSVGESPKQYMVAAKPAIIIEDFDEAVLEDDPIVPDEDSLVDETEDGVEMDEIAGMSEEGEDENKEEMEGEEAGGEEQKEEDY